MKKRRWLLPLLCCILLPSPSFLFAQVKPLRELNVSYPLGGSSSYFWTAYRSGSFEKHGLKLNPVFIPGGVTALQSLMAKELFIELTAGPAAVRAWARGGKEITFIGAVGNRLDYVLVTVPSVRNAEELKRQKGRRKPARSEPRFHRTARASAIGIEPGAGRDHCSHRITRRALGGPQRRPRPRFALPASFYASRPQIRVSQLCLISPLWIFLTFCPVC